MSALVECVSDKIWSWLRFSKIWFNLCVCVCVRETTEAVTLPLRKT